MSKPVRCAVYTRKSSEEGLDQAFNSLDAQRDAGEAYVRSQASEGWTCLPARYDDGGYSGGTLERPALRRLLADIAGGKVDVVVVYKIDRLTRSLPDFSRIVETFDKAGTSFVSVTQSFNTRDSMGRLMLNVLLSFAQFEREVTGERIRDKIAASKAKGLWMGGVLPLGYDLPLPGSRKLEVNAAEAAQVRAIFERYCALGSVHRLQQELSQAGILSKQRVTASGKRCGGQPFSRGALFHLLRNRLYLGQIVHREAIHEGEHHAIVSTELFDQVQQLLDAHARRHRAAAGTRLIKAPLTGRLFDAGGEAMSPTHSRGKSGRSYRYYVSASLQQGGSHNTNDTTIRRVPALAIERTVTGALTRWKSGSMPELIAVRLAADGVLIDLPGKHAADLVLRLDQNERIVHADRHLVRVLLPLALPLRGGRRSCIAGKAPANRPDPTLIAALRRAHRMVTRQRGRPLLATAPASPYDRMVLRLAFLAPDLQADILAGRQPAGFTLERFRTIDLPLAWSAQRPALGWGQSVKTVAPVMDD
jgi:DNA invertase Pin-like site-specific DNA recombinase